MLTFFLFFYENICCDTHVDTSDDLFCFECGQTVVSNPDFWRISHVMQIVPMETICMSC